MVCVCVRVCVCVCVCVCVMLMLLSGFLLFELFVMIGFSVEVSQHRCFKFHFCTPSSVSVLMSEVHILQKQLIIIIFTKLFLSSVRAHQRCWRHATGAGPSVTQRGAWLIRQTCNRCQLIATSAKPLPVALSWGLAMTNLKPSWRKARRTPHRCWSQPMPWRGRAVPCWSPRKFQWRLPTTQPTRASFRNSCRAWRGWTCSSPGLRGSMCAGGGLPSSTSAAPSPSTRPSSGSSFRASTATRQSGSWRVRGWGTCTEGCFRHSCRRPPPCPSCLAPTTTFGWASTANSPQSPARPPMPQQPCWQGLWRWRSRHLSGFRLFSRTALIKRDSTTLFTLPRNCGRSALGSTTAGVRSFFCGMGPVMCSSSWGESSSVTALPIWTKSPVALPRTLSVEHVLEPWLVQGSSPWTWSRPACNLAWADRSTGSGTHFRRCGWNGIEVCRTCSEASTSTTHALSSPGASSMRRTSTFCSSSDSSGQMAAYSDACVMWSSHVCVLW